MAFKFTDKNGFNTIVQKLKKPIVLEVGIIDNPSLASLGAFHEFGTTTIPSRSFLRKYVEQNEPVIVKRLIEALQKIYIQPERNPKTDLNNLGSFMVQGIKTRILSGIAPALKPATQKSKKQNKSLPLVHTGKLLNGIRFRIIG